MSEQNMNKFQGCSSIYYILLLVVISNMFISCFNDRATSENNEFIYASVNGSNLTESELRSFVPMDFYDKLTSEHKKEIVKEWINNELLYHEALRLGIDEEPEISRILKNSKRDLLRNELLERNLGNFEIPDAEIFKQYYKEHMDYFILQSDEYKIRYALFDNINDAQDFWSKVKKGASFSSLAMKESKNPSAKSGGDLGIVNEVSVEPALWEALVNTYETLGLGKISSTFSVIDGWGIVIIDKILKNGTLKPYEAVRDQVIDLYMVEKREESKKALLNKLTVKSTIKFNF